MKLLLLILTGFVAVSALVAGVLMINYPDGSILGIPFNMITASPFDDLVIPGIILGVVVGGVNALAVYHFLDESRQVYNWTAAAGMVTCGWVAVQFIMIHSVLWVQGIYLLAGIATILLSLYLKARWLA